MAVQVGPLGYTPSNKFHAGREVSVIAELQTQQTVNGAAQRVAQAILDAGQMASVSLDRVAAALERLSMDRIEDALLRVAYATEIIAKATANLPDGTVIETALKELAECVCGIREGVHVLGRRDTDNVTALYAAAVDVSGDIVGRTNAGRWLNEAGFASLAGIVRAKPKLKRKDFVDRLRAIAKGFTGLPSVLSDEEIGRFFDYAPSVLEAIEQVPTTPPV
jgi:hypothetical protein